MNERIN